MYTTVNPVPECSASQLRLRELPDREEQDHPEDETNGRSLRQLTACTLAQCRSTIYEKKAPLLTEAPQ